MNNQIVGAAGLHFVCYRLSCCDWNVMATARNARGIDIVAYHGEGRDFIGIQVKALTLEAPVGLTRKSLDHLGGDFWVIVTFARSNPVSYVLTLDEVRRDAVRDNGGGQWWLEPRAYKRPEYREKWDRLELNLPAAGDGGLLP